MRCVTRKRTNGQQACCDWTLTCNPPAARHGCWRSSLRRRGRVAPARTRSGGRQGLLAPPPPPTARLLTSTLPRRTAFLSTTFSRYRQRRCFACQNVSVRVLTSSGLGVPCWLRMGDRGNERASSSPNSLLQYCGHCISPLITTVLYQGTPAQQRSRLNSISPVVRYCPRPIVSCRLLQPCVARRRMPFPCSRTA